MPGGAILPAIIGAGGALGAGFLASNSADKAAKAQENAANRAADVQLKMYRQTRKDLKPYSAVGLPAMRSMASMYGLTPGSTAFNDKSLEAFRAAPDYQIAMREGMRALDNTAAARGMLKSGGTIKGAMEYASDLGTRKLDDYMARLAQMAGMGQNAAARTGSAAMQTGSGLANTYLGAGEAAASGIIGSGNAWGNAMSNAADNAIYALERNPSAYLPPPSIY